MQELYEPEAYFDRLDNLVLEAQLPLRQTRAAYWRRHPWARMRGLQRCGPVGAGVFPPADEARARRRAPPGLPDAGGASLRRRPDPAILFMYLLKCAMHYHHYTMARRMARQETPVVNSY